MTAMTPVLSVNNIALALLVHFCYIFNSVYTKNNKLLGEWYSKEDVYPILYEAVQEYEINEDNPPDPPRDKVVMTFPGTKWCGPGNVAKNYHDVGIFKQTDKCCRAHDYCADVIYGGDTAHGLQNDNFYSKLNCKCDEKFRMCLHKAKDGMANNMGKLYFNAIGTRCFRLDHPIVRCIRYGFLKRKCLEYEVDSSKPKEYQWFDVPPY